MSFISALSSTSGAALLGCLVLLAAVPIKSQEPESDFRNIFGADYIRAEQFLSENGWMADSLRKNGFDPCFTFAIIFPELVRYSSIRDYMETKSLEVLYVQYGSVYANFSIGHFQMKPAFAESIEEELRKQLLPVENTVLRRLSISDTSSAAIRKARLFRLKEMKSQLMYLQAFMWLIERYYPEWDTLPPDTRLRYYASAYNCGYRKGREYIEGISDQKYFYTGLPVNATKYSYTNISSFFYQSCKLDARE